MTWQTDLLARWGAPASSTNVEALTLWAQGEGTTDENNPLAVSGWHVGATKCLAQCGTGSPVYAYGTMAQGVAATTAFAAGSNSAGIVASFRDNAGLLAIFDAINSSEWCRGCQGGRYPEPLWAAVFIAGPPPPPAPPVTDMEVLFDMLTDPDFAVRFLFRFLLHREVDPAGFATYVGQLTSGSTLNEVMAEIQDSPEGQGVLAAERHALGI